MENTIILNDIAYGTHERQIFDIAIPQNPKSACGVILFIHGGGWIHGDKSEHRDDIIKFSDEGYLCATMNYRFVTEDLTVFDELDDVEAALREIKSISAKYGFSIEKSILSGVSAGAHLSLMYAYTRQANAPVPTVAACPYCPPVDCSKSDFLIGISGEFEDWKYEVLSTCCGVKITKENFLTEEPQKALKKMSPWYYVSENCVPTAVFQGVLDELIPFYHVENFIKLLNEKGVKNDFLIYENSNHALDKDPDKTIQSKGIIKRYAELYF